jgi:hypothetical protein
MFQYRAVLVRLRQGDSERDIARARLMGRRKLAAFRALASRHGWLDTDAPLPEDAQIAAVVGQARRARSTISTVEAFREIVTRWAEQGVGGVAIHAALCREHGYSGSYSAVRRMLQAIDAARPPQATVRLQFAPGEAAQVDFGAGPILFDPARGEQRRTWCFVMTLCFSRHQYVEFVWDQTVATWLVLRGIRPDGHCPLGLNCQPSRKRSPLCESWVGAIDPLLPSRFERSGPSRTSLRGQFRTVDSASNPGQADVPKRQCLASTRFSTPAKVIVAGQRQYLVLPVLGESLRCRSQLVSKS